LRYEIQPADHTSQAAIHPLAERHPDHGTAAARRGGRLLLADDPGLLLRAGGEERVLWRQRDELRLQVAETMINARAT
jgi:hypothetical protein